MTTEKIEIRETINDVPVRFTVYHRNASMSGNFIHSFMSPGREYTWFIIGEVNDDGMTTEEFFASPLAQYEGVFWCGNTEDADYQDTLAKVRTLATEDIERRNLRPPLEAVLKRQMLRTNMLTWEHTRTRTMNTKTPKLTAAQQRAWNSIANTFQNQVRDSYHTLTGFVVTGDKMHSVYGSGINGRTLQAIAKAGLIIFTDGTRFKHPYFKLTQAGLDALPDVEDEYPPVAEPTDTEWNEPGYIGDGFTNEYDYDHPVHSNAIDNAIQSGAEADFIDDVSGYTDGEDTPRSHKEKSDKSIVVKSEFHYGQTRMIVRVDGEREYDTTKLSTRTARRLLAVLESIPTSCRQVEFDSDFSPIVYLHWKAARIDAGLFPAAHPRPTVPAELADCYDSFTEFASEVERLWSLDECLEYPCQTTLSHALDLLRGIAREGGYDVLLPGYEKFVAVCQDDTLLMDADKLLENYTPRVERDSRWYGLVRK